MQTRFTAEQRADPAIATSESILRKCVHCGFCTATCPTYVLLGDELDSPRGRIYLIKDMLESGRPATPEVVTHIDRCLSCLGCMTTCPSGVHYQHLIDHARVHVEETYRRPLADRALRNLLAAVMPYPNRFRAILRLAKLVRPLAGLMPLRLRAMLELVPRSAKRVSPTQSAMRPGTREAERPVAETNAGAGREGLVQSERRARPRVAVLIGCVQSVLGASINAATVRLLERAGFEPVPVEGCCGSIVHHLGRAEKARELARALTARIDAIAASGPVEALVINASGCGTHLKDLGFLYRNDPALADAAEKLSAISRDITEFLAERGWPEVLPGRRDRGSSLVVAYHSACSMQHGQGLHEVPRRLLRSVGFEVADISEGHLCCGSAGTYNMLQPALAGRLRDRKLDNIAATGAAIVATGNLGCITQIGSASDRPVVHTVELLDWATGGPRPPGLGPALDAGGSG